MSVRARPYEEHTTVPAGVYGERAAVARAPRGGEIR